MPLRPSRVVCLAGVLALLTACSATQFAYNRLDFIARWSVARYVSLSTAQRETFDAGFRDAWTWHRHHELPLYAATLREMAARVEHPPTPGAEELQAWSNRYAELWSASLTRLLPLACRLGTSLSDEQVDELLKHVDKGIADYAKKYVAPPPATLRKHAQREVEKNLRQWLDNLTPVQKQLLHDWVAERPDDAAPDWLAFRHRWRDALAGVLAARHSTDFCAKLAVLVRDADRLWTPEQQRSFADNRRHWTALFVRLGPTLTNAQRQALRRRLLELADDLEALSVQAS